MSAVTILAVGDVGTNRADPASMFAAVRATLASVLVVSGQLETVVSDRGAIVPDATLALHAPTALAAGLARRRRVHDDVVRGQSLPRLGS